MKSHFKLAVDFVESIKDKTNILQIVLFGSVARREETSKSDIDIAIIHNSKDYFKLMSEVNKNKNENIQTSFFNIKDLPKEIEIISTLSGEGILLYGKSILIKENQLDLNSKIIISYSLKDLKQTEKVKLNRALYGSISKSFGEKKEYVTQTKGLTNEIGIEKINDSVLLVDRRKSTKIINLLKRFKANYKEIPVWGY